MSSVPTIRIPVSDDAIAALDELHDRFGANDIQTIRGGSQVGLTGCGNAAVQAMIEAINAALGLTISEAWTIRMQKGGRHIKHNHPAGRLSGVYYLRVGPGGVLVLNDELYIVPQRGDLVIFPSWIPHETTEYHGDHSRLTVAFDVK